jgi:CheY-like chemotaxis protein
MFRVLVVDDDPALREMLGMVLTDEGYDVRRARHGLEAVAHIEGGFRPDVVLLDYMMPYMDGGEVCDWLRAHLANNERPAVVILSASLDALAAKPQADAFLQKPYSLDVVLEHVRRFCDQRVLRMPQLLPHSFPATA